MKMSSWAKALVIFLVVALVAVIAGVSGREIYLKTPVKSSDTMKEITLDGVDTLRIGVASDTQMPGAPSESTKEADNLRACLKLLKEQKINMLIFPGDISDYASKYSYSSFLEILEEVFPEDDDSTPYMFFIMGNHDMWFASDYSSVPPKHRLYKKMFKVDPNIHWKVNGVHFIGASPDDTSNADGYSGTMRVWIENEIRKAESDTPEGNPIFVVTHHNIPATAYGSSQWGDERVRQAVSNHPQVVSISGHSHYSILDERSISQNMMTAFTTQSLAYVDMENGMFSPFKGINGEGKFVKRNAYSSAPARQAEKPMCLIMNVGKENTVIERWNVLDKIEEKADNRWILNYPLNRGSFEYKDSERENASVAPEFPANAKIEVNSAIKSFKALDNGEFPTLPGVSFTAATHKDLVNKYSLHMKNKATGEKFVYDTYSDYYLGIENMATTVDLAIDPTLPSGQYEISVYAYESFGKRSQPLTLDVDWKQPAIEIFPDTIEK